MRPIAVLYALAVLGLSRPCHAASQAIIADTTDDIAYWGTQPTGYFGGSDRGDFIGDGFDTSRIKVTETATRGGLGIDFKLYTQFSGNTCIWGTCVHYADLFLRSPSQGYGGAPFDYAIALGGQAANGGLGTAGLYAVTAYETSQDIWASRTDFIYGGAYTDQTGSVPAQAVPTVLTSGTLIAPANVHESADGNGDFVVDVSLVVDSAQAALFLGGYDVLWGTGDCANDTIIGTVPAPEPAALAVLATGLGGLVCLRRRRR